MSFAIVAGAGIAAGAGLLGAWIGSEAAKDAAETQAAAATTAATTTANAATAAITSQENQFTKMQEILAPYVKTGNDAMAQQRALSGLDGPEAQRAAIEAISGSQEMSGLVQQGENAMLQQGAATGGLRGGNMQGALAQFRPQMLSSLISQQYGRLSGLTQIGQASAAGVGVAGMNMAQNVGNLQLASGQAIAGGQMAAGNAQANAQLASGQAYANVPNYFVQGGMYGYGLGAPAAAAPAAPANTNYMLGTGLPGGIV